MPQKRLSRRHIALGRIWMIPDEKSDGRTQQAYVFTRSTYVPRLTISSSPQDALW